MSLESLEAWFESEKQRLTMEFEKALQSGTPYEVAREDFSRRFRKLIKRFQDESFKEVEKENHESLLSRVESRVVKALDSLSDMFREEDY